ncbi:MAG: cation-transporting P-type ATPase [Firmicutes bacterium]|uniref:Cation-transporting P-type ATPase n=1 Tax=Candidatus Onthovivens merdipullorum TaxID=2840889 RepID=A0A9D9DMY8_9BACL|nr:cation-transporting P-type ATPase [Candidatus Onthovivens merdipullorum]
MDERISKLYKGTSRQVYQELETSAHGLTSEEAKIRLEKYGKNTVEKKKKASSLKLFFKNFISTMAILLWVAGTIAIISCFIASESPSSIGVLKDPGMLYLGIAIYLVNIINGVFSFVQQFKANKSTEALSKMLPTYARVIRDGVETQIEACDLVIGDLVILSEGDKISADARIINCNDLTCNQSTLDGEATPSRKQYEPIKDDVESSIRIKNFVYAGTSVSTGTARCIVVATGMNTEFGKIASLTQEIDNKLSPLEKEIEKMTKGIALIALSIGLIVLILGIVINGFQQGFSSPTLYLNQFVTALGMVVAFIPEGLSPTVSLSLAKAVQRLAKEGALIKNLSSAETLGSTTVICSDKTGTLTKNEMTVKYLYLLNQEFEVTGDGYDFKGEILDKSKNKVTSITNLDLKMLLMCGALCSNAKLTKDENGKIIVLGDPTEACLGVVSEKGLLNPINQMRLTPRIRELPFDSVRKMMTTIHQLEKETNGAQRIAFTKGSPNDLVAKCKYILDNGKIREITKEDKERIKNQNDKFAKDGLRVLAMSYRLLKKDDKSLPLALSAYTPEIIEQNMVFIGLEAMQDPPREGIKEAIEVCHKAGIKVIMITGDYSLTALAIAKKIGIVKDKDPRVISGAELNNIDDKTLKEYLKGEVIFARMAPEQKYLIVNALQELGEIVAVTGDGVNDAPALKKADIGIAMGITGTDVAKEAADMILTDDNFVSIVKAIEEGRAIFSNIKKFATYIFNSNVPEAIPFLLPLLTFNKIPVMLTILEVLLIDIGTDMLPALGLGSELPQKGIMEQPPRKSSDHLINKKLYGKAIYYGIQTSILCLVAFFTYTAFRSESLGLPYTFFSQLNNEGVWMECTTVVLTSIIFCQVGMVFNCRTDKESVFKVGIFKNKEINIGIIFELILILLVIFVPFINTEVFETNMILDYRIWLIMLTFPFIIVGIDEIRKYIIRKRERKEIAQ